MPTSAPKPCRHPGCKLLVKSGAYCDEHLKQSRKDQDTRRGNSSERGYNNRWQKARASFLSRSPLCVKCIEEGKVVAATVVDHIIPHRGDMALFWDSDNWQPLCKRHHDSAKQAEERVMRGAGQKSRA